MIVYYHSIMVINVIIKYGVGIMILTLGLVICSVILVVLVIIIIFLRVKNVHGYALQWVTKLLII